MNENFKFKLKKTIIGIFILKIKFFLNLGLEKEAKYLKKNYKFKNSADIGSNTGYYSNMLLKISDKVFSFEPIKYHCINQKKIFKNRNITVYNFGLSNEQSRKKLYIPNNNDPEASFINKNYDFYINFVNIKKGDHIFKNKKIDFIKIDVEGYELNVLKGLISQIKKFKPFLLIEIEKRHNENFIKVFNFLKKFNYKIYYLTKNNDLKEIYTDNMKKFFKHNQKLKVLNTDRYINNFFFK